MTTRASLLLASAVVAGTSLVPLQAQVVISEFMASNSRGLRDENNRFVDWIELQNVGTNAVNLDGWFLTDNANNLTKWRLPATNINVGGFIIVFATGDNRAVPGAPLHANFSLSGSGEYLGLVKPDGTTIASEYRPSYPGQVPDVSYGLASIVTNITTISSNSAVRVRVPAGNEGDWRAVDFNDSGWTVGTNGVGYGSFAQANYAASVLPTAPVGYWRLNEISGTSAANLGSGAANGTYNNVVLGNPGPQPSAFNGFEADNTAAQLNGSSAFVAGPAGLLNNRNAFTVGGWIYPTATPAARTGLFGQNDCVEFGFITGTTLECWTPGGGMVTGVPYPHPLNTWHHVMAVADGNSIRIYIDGQQVGVGGNAGVSSYGSSSFNFNIGGGGIQDAAGNFFPGRIDEVVVYHRALSASEVLGLYQAGTVGNGGSSSTLVRTDNGAAMSNVNASAFVRVPFTVENPTNVSLVTLRMRYNDGFVAWLNGTEVLRMNASGTVEQGFTAGGVHSSTAVEEFRLGAAALRQGTNVLAIQGLNVSADDTNFFISAEMALTVTEGSGIARVFFTTPSPGAPNFGGIANPGPAIANTDHTPNVPSDADDIFVTARVTPTFYPITNVVARYRVMFGSEVELPMRDDGLNGDGAAGDGVYGARIPASASTNGQMVRWFFRATDNRGNHSRWPIFANASASAEYLGTVVNPGYVTSKLPIVHLFAAPGVLQGAPPTQQTGADSQTGGRVSLFFDGEFYDNVHMELRGNSTASFNKKSHRLEFNREHPFRYSDDAPRIRKTSFVADWPDPTYMRQGLSYWLADIFGAPAPFYQPMRLQLNGQFYQLANHNDVHGEELLDRLGLDPNGALYNAAGQVTPSRASTGGFDKKTRTWEGDADYVAMATAIGEANNLAVRATNVFDMFDIPEMLNYLTVARWVHENDDVWANLSLYRDSDGDQLWRIIPFDMNLSWGAIFAEGDAGLYTGVQATNDTHKSHPLYGGANILARSGPAGAFNRVYDVFFQVPELRQMFLRRLRTLLDTYVKGLDTPTNSTVIEQRILATRDLIAEEAIRDRALWGWPAVGGQNNFAPGIDITNGVNQLLEQFFRARRRHFYVRHSITNLQLTVGLGTNNSAGIPLAQPTNVVVHVGLMDANPSSGLQGHEFIQITNPNPFAVDISGWKLDGGVDFRFRPGTVLVSNGVLYLTPDLKVFRTRTTAPRPGMGLFVVGDYQGQLDARGEPVLLFDDVGRLVHTNSFTPSPSPAQLYLRITELMYHPGPLESGSPFAREDFEYIELKNIGPATLNLAGVHFTNGVTFAFTSNSPVSSLAPGQTVVLVKNAAAFQARYGNSITIAGTYTGSLDNGGERLSLHDAVGEQIMDFTYDNNWYPVTDGPGLSLVIINENADWTSWDLKESWRPSSTSLGSPGATDPAPPVALAPVIVNEVLAHSELPDVDRIEIWNPTTNSVDIGDWWISDDFLTPQKYRIPGPRIIPPGGYTVFTEADFNVGNGPNAFSFSSRGDEAFIFSGNAAGQLTGYFDGFDFNASLTGESFGRYTNALTNVVIVAQSSNTFGFQNGTPRVGPIVISEIMYHPVASADGDDALDEFIELHNISSNAVALYDTAFPTNRWQLADAVEFEFSTNAVVPANGFLLVVNFNPTNTALLSSFRARFNVPAEVPIVGPLSGRLDNAGEPIELYRPDTPEAGEVPFVLVERVRYANGAPWDSLANGFGPSLHRRVESDYGNNGTNWFAALPSPGRVTPVAQAPSITVQPQDAVVVEANNTNITVGVSGDAPFGYQWRFNGVNIPGQTGASLSFSNSQLSQTGLYSVVVMNYGGVAFSSNAYLNVLPLPVITLQPTNMMPQPSNNATMTVGATGTGTLRYQWYFNDQPIAGATNASYTVTNAQLNTHSGFYYATVTDEVGVQTTRVASLVVAVRPFVITQPVSQVVVRGGTAYFALTAGPVHPMLPLTFRWLRSGSPVATNTTGDLVVNNVLASTSYRVQVLNAAGNVNSSTATLTMLNDADADFMADIFEQQYGFSTNNAADALLDMDGDGMNNRDELIAGTNPTDASSVLKLTQSLTNTTVLEFVAQTNNSYMVQFRTNLSQAVWTPIATQTPNASQVRTVTVHTPFPGTGEGYYRVMTPVQ
jgi:hypothetical protein